MSGADQGRGGVVRAALAAATEEFSSTVAAKPEQAALFEPPTRFHGARREGVKLQTERHARAGRPAGAQNLSTREFRDYLHRMGVSPLVALMRFAVMPPHLLAQELGCTLLEAFREWRMLQEALAPYLHSKMALVDDQGQAVPYLQMVFGGAAGAGIADASGRFPPWHYLDGNAMESQQNQALSSAEPAVSDDKVSDGGAK